MADKKISDFIEITNPTASARIAGVDPGSSATENYKFSPAALKQWLAILVADVSGLQPSLDAKANQTEVFAPVPQFQIGASETLALSRAIHQGASISLLAGGANIAFSATTQGNGFVFTVYNETGSNWTIPSFTGATNRYPKGVAHTQIESGGVASFETITQGGVMRVRINGDTV